MTADSKIKLDFVTEIDFSQILTNPILDIAARVWDDDRYQAFRVCYRSMRIIDDLVDNQKSSGPSLTEDEQRQIKFLIENWITNLIDRTPVDNFQAELLKTMDKFKIPPTPWARMAKAMIYDLNHNGFSSIISFLRYSEGAAIAPASIFMHLCGIRKKGDDYVEPEYDIRNAARYLAIFSYFVHIIRDFQKDRQAGLNYFADSILNKYRVDDNTLNYAAKEHEISHNFRKMIGHYYRIIEYYRLKSRSKIEKFFPLLEDRYQLSLQLIYNLYYQIFLKINPEKGCFTSTELNPTEIEVKQCIEQTISSFKPTN